MEKILEEIREEKKHQDKKWGGPKHDDQHDAYAWAVLVTSYFGQAVSDFVNESGRHEARYRKFRYNMVKVAALAVAAIEVVDRKLGNG